MYKYFFYIVRTTSQSGGYDPSDIDLISEKINNAYNPYGIYMNNIGFDYIDNSTYYNIDDQEDSNTEFDALIQIKNKPNAINF